MKLVKMEDAEVPKIGLGTWQIKGNDCRKAVENALEMGYRHIDTAQIYGNEEHVGTGIANSGVDREYLAYHKDLEDKFSSGSCDIFFP